MSRQGKLAALASTGVTKAELDLLDGVTSTTAELNITDGVTATAAELNILDGVTATAAEINLIDGGTARGTTAVADGDGFLTNDGGTMRMTKVDTLATYMGTKIGGGLEFISTADASNTATISFTGFDASKYDSYLFTFLNVVAVQDGTQLILRTSTDSGSNYDSGSSDYLYQICGNKGASDFAEYDATHTKINLSYNQGTASGEEGGLSGHIFMHGPHIALPTRIVGQSFYFSSVDGNGVSVQTAGQRHSSADVDAAQFLMGSGNIASGTITMYGMVNS